MRAIWGRLLILSVSWGLIAMFVLSGQHLLLLAPRGWRAETVRLSADDKAVAVTADMLGQLDAGAAAGPVRFWVRRDREGRWQFAADFDHRPVHLVEGGVERDIRHAALTVGDRIVAGAGWLELSALTAQEAVFLASDGRQVRWSRTQRRLFVGGVAMLDSCDSASSVFRRLWGGLSDLLGDRRFQEHWFSIGGSLDCPDRLSFPDLPAHGLLVSGGADGLTVRQMVGIDTRLQPKGGSPSMALYRPWTTPTMAGPTHLVAGGVRYEVRPEGANLLLRPLGNRRLLTNVPTETEHAWLEPEASEEGVWIGQGWTWRETLAHPLALPLLGTGLGLATLLAVAGWAARGRLARTWTGLARNLTVAIAVGAGSAATVLCILLRTVDLTVPLMIMAAMWVPATLVLVWGGPVRRFLIVHWYASMLLCGLGVEWQLQLAIVRGTERFVGYAAKTALVWVVLLIAFMLLRSLPRSRLVGGVRYLLAALPARLGRSWRQWLPLWLFIVAIGPLPHLRDALAGREAGNGFYQPSQASATLYLFCLSMLACWLIHFSRVNERAAAWTRSLWSLSPAIIVAISLLLTYWAAGDASPVLMLGLCTVSMTLLLWVCIRRELMARRGAHILLFVPSFLLLVSVAVAAVPLSLGMEIGEVATALAGKTGTLRDEVRRDPCGDPRGEQVCKALAIVRAAGEALALGRVMSDHPYSVQSDPVIAQLPVIESDMILAFVLHQWGLLPLMLLLAIQLVYVLAMAAAAWTGLTQHKGGLDIRLVASFIGMFCAGLTFLQAQHFLIGLSNASASWFWLMGQPTSFLSAGTSHHLLVAGIGFLLPGVLERIVDRDGPRGKVVDDDPAQKYHPR
jgi:hypothetical protein